LEELAADREVRAHGRAALDDGAVEGCDDARLGEQRARDLELGSPLRDRGAPRGDLLEGLLQAALGRAEPGLGGVRDRLAVDALARERECSLAIELRALEL